MFGASLNPHSLSLILDNTATSFEFLLANNAIIFYLELFYPKMTFWNFPFYQDLLYTHTNKYVCACVYIWRYVGTHGGQNKMSGSLQQELYLAVNNPTQRLGTKFWSSTRAASLLNCWPISSPCVLKFSLFWPYLYLHLFPSHIKRLWLEINGYILCTMIDMHFITLHNSLKFS